MSIEDLKDSVFKRRIQALRFLTQNGHAVTSRLIFAPFACSIHLIACFMEKSRNADLDRAPQHVERDFGLDGISLRAMPEIALVKFLGESYSLSAFLGDEGHGKPPSAEAFPALTRRLL